MAFSGGHTIAIQISTRTLHPELLTALEVWQTVGLLENTGVELNLRIDPSHPQFLQGLEALCQGGLISDTAILEICQENLISRIPTPVIPNSSSTVSLPISPVSDFAPESTPQKKKPSWLSQRWEGLIAEISVRWLLFLGVFLVILSSGVMAASQWSRFPAVIQYGVLFTYTLGFGGMSLWTSQKSRLRLTSQTLRIVALLLIPVNFWAMDELGLWRNPFHWIVILVATGVLSLVGLFLWKRERTTILPIISYLWLSYLNWGWEFPGFPITAIYLGVGGAVTALCFACRKSNSPLRQDIAVFRLVFYSVGILIFRAISGGIDISQLGLAIAVCGWFFAWLSQESRKFEGNLPVTILNRLGGGLLLFGWLVSLGERYPWPALIISGLGIWFFDLHLKREWRRRNLVMIFAIGLQMFWVFWECIPFNGQQQIISVATQLTNSQDYPGTLLTVYLFPYLLWVISISDFLHHSQQKRLAKFGEIFALEFASFLAIISFSNICLQTLYFFNLTLTFAILTRRREYLGIRNALQLLIYFTHITGVITLLSGIDYGFPNLNPSQWVGILLVLMVAEWMFSDYRFTLNISQVNLPHLSLLWWQTAWHLGLFFATLSYTMILGNYNSQPWTLWWLIVPVGLTGIATQKPSPRKRLASVLSIVASMAVQLFTVSIPGWRLLSLGLTTILLGFNTRYLQDLTTALITVGFALSFLGTLLGETLSPSVSGWLIAGAMTLMGLWIGRGYVEFGVERTSLNTISKLYAQAMDVWAVLLGVFLLTIHPIGVYEYGYFNGTVSLIVNLLIMGAITYRSLQIPRRRERRRGAANTDSVQSSQNGLIWSSIAGIIIAQIPLMNTPGFRLGSIAIATLLLLFHIYYLRKPLAAAIVVGFGISLGGCFLWDVVQLKGLYWFVVGAACILGLWLSRRWFQHLHHQQRLQTPSLYELYSHVFDKWAIALCSVELGCLTVHSILVYYFAVQEKTVPIFMAGGLLLGAIAYRSLPNPSNWSMYGMGWLLELLTAEAIGVFDSEVITLAVANLALGLIAQLLGDWWQRRSGQSTLLNSWNVIPLLYGILGTVLRWGTFSSWSGLTFFALALIAIGVGRRSSAFKPLIYCALFGVFISAYELLFYQFSLYPGGEIGDGLILMAGLGTGMMYGYRVLSPFLTGYLTLTPQELKWISHLHWGWSSILLLIATNNRITDFYLTPGFGIGVFLVLYSIYQGKFDSPSSTLRRGEIWVYLGFVEAWGMRIYWLSTPVARLLGGPLVAWKGAIAAVFAYFLYVLPWKEWGWSQRPWKLAAFLLPLIALAENLRKGIYIDNNLSLVIIAIFYIGLGILNRQVRYSYLSIIVMDWLMWRWLLQVGIDIGFWYVLPLGLSLLYITHVDPLLQHSKQQFLRHILRLVGSSMICILSFEISSWIGLTTGFVSLIYIFAGLAYKIRAYLLVGTTIFLGNAIYQLGLLSLDYPFSKWIIGLCVGIILIWIAATFETRREQITAWIGEFKTWE